IGLGNGTPTPFGFQPLDFRELRQIAETTGGRFFQPRNAQDLAEVYAQIDALETVELADPRYRTVDCFELPLAAGLATLLLALLLDALLLRRAPCPTSSGRARACGRCCWRCRSSPRRCGRCSTARALRRRATAPCRRRRRRRRW
ncbi:MAG: hypothetical protein ACK6D1_10075, partial [Planctomycetota bacterium]